MPNPALCLLLPLLAACQSTPNVEPETAIEQEFSTHSLHTANYLKARVAEHQGDIPHAAAKYLQILSTAPDNPELRRDAFATTLSAGDLSNAMRLAQTLSPDEAPEALVHVIRALAEVERQDYDIARENILRARATAPNLLQFDLYRAYLDIAAGRDPEKTIERLIDLEIPPLLEAQRLYHLGRLREQSGALENAAELYAAALQAEPGALLPTWRLTSVFIQLGQEDAARAILHRFERNNPQSVLTVHLREQLRSGKVPPPLRADLYTDWAEVSFGFGLLMWVQGYPVPARQLLQLSNWLHPELALPSLFLGMLAEEQEFTDLARKHYLSVNPSSAGTLAAQLRLAELEHTTGNEADAMHILQNLIDQGHTHPAVRQVLGDLLFRAGDYHGAIAQFTKLLDRIEEPAQHHASLYFARGASHERLRDIEAASLDLEQALTLQPDNPTVLNYLGYMWADNNTNLEAALELVGRALLLRPNDGAIIDSVGWVYFKQGDYDRALKYLERAVELEPTDPTINRHLGDIYEALERPKEAKRQWQRALKLGPTDPNELSHLKQKLGLVEAAER